jgi:hypothetical protein
MSDFMAYDGNQETWVDLRTCSDAELFAWADSSLLHGDDVVLRDCITLLDQRDVPHSYAPNAAPTYQVREDPNPATLPFGTTSIGTPYNTADEAFAAIDTELANYRANAGQWNSDSYLCRVVVEIEDDGTERRLRWPDEDYR